MKKIYMFITTLLLLTLILTSCSRVRSISSAPMATIMPMVVEREAFIDTDSKDESTAESQPYKEAALNEDFEKLRETALSFVPEGEGLDQQLFRKLINYDENTIILARILPNVNAEPTNSDESGFVLPSSAYIVNIVAETYELSDGELIEKGITSGPVLFTADEETNLLEKVFVPEMYDAQIRSEDIIKIFGVEKETDLGLAYDEKLYGEYRKNLSEIKYNIALAGGFDGFDCKTAEVLNILQEKSYFNIAQQDGAIREYFVQNTFSYNWIDLPMWHELGREEKDIWVKLYTVMYFGQIGAEQVKWHEVGMYYLPVVIEMKLIDGAWVLKEPVVIGSDGQERIDAVNENFGEYAEECLAFSDTQEAKYLIEELEQMQKSLVDSISETGD